MNILKNARLTAFVIIFDIIFLSQLFGYVLYQEIGARVVIISLIIAIMISFFVALLFGPEWMKVMDSEKPVLQALKRDKEYSKLQKTYRILVPIAIFLPLIISIIFKNLLLLILTMLIALVVAIWRVHNINVIIGQSKNKSHKQFSKLMNDALKKTYNKFFWGLILFILIFFVLIKFVAPLV
jgi:hypothetical protein